MAISPLSGSTGAQASDGQAEIAALKAEISSVKSELQCTECEDDQDSLEQQIKQLETQLRQMMSQQSSAQTEVQNPDQVQSIEASASETRSGNISVNDGSEREKAATARLIPLPGEPGYVIDITA